MENGNHSMVVTFFLCLALCAGNVWVVTRGFGFFNYLALWPVGFILCVVIAARFFRGHGDL